MPSARSVVVEIRRLRSDSSRSVSARVRSRPAPHRVACAAAWARGARLGELRGDVLGVACRIVGEHREPAAFECAPRRSRRPRRACATPTPRRRRGRAVGYRPSTGGHPPRPPERPSTRRVRRSADRPRAPVRRPPRPRARSTPRPSAPGTTRGARRDPAARWVSRHVVRLCPGRRRRAPGARAADRRRGRRAPRATDRTGHRRRRRAVQATGRSWRRG